jgi:hypothetical protein
VKRALQAWLRENDILCKYERRFEELRFPNMTQAAWEAHPENCKAFIDGKPYRLQVDEKTGTTIFVPVQIVCEAQAQAPEPVAEKPSMKLHVAAKLAVEKDDAVMLGKVVDQLRFQFGFNYEQCLQIVQKHTGIDQDDYEDLMYEADTMESELWEAAHAATGTDSQELRTAPKDQEEAVTESDRAPSLNQAPPDQDNKAEEVNTMPLTPSDKAGLVAAAALATVAFGKPVYENRRDAWQKLVKEWHVEEQATKDVPATVVASAIESNDSAEIPEALTEPNDTGTVEAPTVTELEKNRPLLELKCGRVQGSIWDYEGPNGDIHYSLTLTRSWKDPEGNLRQMDHLDPEDLLYAKEVLEKAEQILKEELGQSVTTEVKVTSPRYEEKKQRQKQNL